MAQRRVGRQREVSPLVSLLSTGTLAQRHRVLAVLVILGIAATVLWFWFVPGYGGGVDEASYFLTAKMMALHGGNPAYHSADPTLFVPENMVEPTPGVYYPIYPIGYPALAALGYWMGGPVGAFVVNPVLTLAALLGVFLLARHFLNDLFAMAALLILATHPVVLHFGTAALSHTPDLAFATWGLYFASLWYRKHDQAEAGVPVAGQALRAHWQMLVAGLLLGFAVCMRYTETLLLLPLGWLVLLWAMRLPKDQRRWRRLAAPVAMSAAGWLAGVCPVLWYQWMAFASPLTTGYSLLGASHPFSLHWFVESFGFTALMLCTPPNGLIVLPLAVAGLFLWKWVKPAEAGFLGLAFVPTLLVYTACPWMNTEQPLLYARYFLPAFPVIVIGGLIPVQRLSRRWLPAQVVIVAALVLYASVNLKEAPQQAQFNGTALIDEAATRLANDHLPKDAVIIADSFAAYSMIYYTDMAVIYPRYFNESWVQQQIEASLRLGGLPAHFNALREKEFEEALGHRTQGALFALLKDKLMGCVRQGRTVALVAQDDDPRWYAVLQDRFRFTQVARNERFGVTLWRLDLK